MPFFGSDNTMATGLYIHIPFCASRCIYCGFYSTVPRQTSSARSLRSRYIDAMCKEIRQYKTRLSTIYFGGGTPSQLTPEELGKIFTTIDEHFQLSQQNKWPSEITLECNPDDVTEEFCEGIKNLPINRISMGVQTFSDERLTFLHRRHNAKEVYAAIERLRTIGIDNLSIDLMFGFPDETIEEWQSDVKRAIALNVEHISSYSLMYEENTPLYKLLKNRKIKQIDEELYRTMYEYLIDELEKAGYNHYEISNFAKPGYESKHNSSYWENIPYIGIGASAHSYNIKTRRWNVANIKEYTEAIEQNLQPYEVEYIDADKHYNDAIVTALRTKKGLNISDFPPEYQQYFLKNVKPFLENGQIRMNGNNFYISRKGLYVSDAIMVELIKA